MAHPQKKKPRFTPNKQKIKMLSKRIKFKFLEIILGKKHYITCHGKTDGIGAQALAIMSAQLFAYHFKVNYIHTPFNNIQFQNSREKELESFMNLGEGETKITETSMPVARRKKLAYFFKKNVIYEIPHFHEFTDLNTEKYLLIKPILQKKFNINKPTAAQENSNELRISLHLRRGDVTADQHPDRFTNNEVTISRLKTILDQLNSLNVNTSLTIISEGSEQDFAQFKENLNTKINYLLDANIESTLNKMINTDVLIIAKSALSYCAALLTNATVIYEEFWHKPLPNWFNIDDEPTKLIQYLSKLKHHQN